MSTQTERAALEFYLDAPAGSKRAADALDFLVGLVLGERPAIPDAARQFVASARNGTDCASGKVRFGSFASAQAFMEKKNSLVVRAQMRVYDCGLCGGWHFGHWRRTA